MIYDDLETACRVRDVQWDPEFKLGPLFSATELGGEVGEVLNVVKKLEREKLGLPGSRDTVDHLAEELADATICVQNLANRYNINLPRAVADKFNKTSVKVGLSTMMRVPG